MRDIQHHQDPQPRDQGGGGLREPGERRDQGGGDTLLTFRYLIIYKLKREIRLEIVNLSFVGTKIVRFSFFCRKCNLISLPYFLQNIEPWVQVVLAMAESGQGVWVAQVLSYLLIILS